MTGAGEAEPPAGQTAHLNAEEALGNERETGWEQLALESDPLSLPCEQVSWPRVF